MTYRNGGNMPQCGIKYVVGQKNQMSSNHPSLNARSKLSMSITESDPQIKEASPRRKHDDI